MEQLALFADIDEKYIRIVLVRELRNYKALKVRLTVLIIACFRK
ncbi:MULTISPECIES: hypothetical protein [Bacillus]|nr:MULTISPECIES: hypothetical protein [Bacillus]